jgi:uncharacterized protein (TIGR02118 family)
MPLFRRPDVTWFGSILIKLSFCLHRLPGLTREAFHAYWFEKHAPLVASHRSALRIRRYVQQHSATTELNDGIRAGRGAPEMFDGIAELWWDNFEELQAAMVLPEGHAASLELLEDERKFIDLSRSPLWFSDEKQIF